MSTPTLIRPSDLDRIAACPGSVQAAALATSLKEDSSLSLRGDAVHECVQAWAMDGDAGDWKKKYFDLSVDDRSRVRQSMQDIDAMLYSIVGEAKPLALHVEYKLGSFISQRLTNVNPESGSADLIYVYPDEVVVADLKGRDVLRAEEHYQLLAYMVGAFVRWTGMARVHGLILPADAPPSMVTYERAQLPLLVDLLQRRINAAVQPDAPKTPGSGCRFCPAFGTAACKETETQVLATLHGNSDVAKPLTIEAATFLAFNSKAIEELVGRAKKLIRDEIARAPDSHGLPFRVNKPSFIKHILDAAMDQGIVDVLKAECGLDSTTLYQCCQIHRSKLIDAIMVHDRINEDQAKAKLDRILEDYGWLGTREQSGALVPIKTKPDAAPKAAQKPKQQESK